MKNKQSQSLPISKIIGLFLIIIVIIITFFYMKNSLYKGSVSGISQVDYEKDKKYCYDLGQTSKCNWFYFNEGSKSTYKTFLEKNDYIVKMDLNNMKVKSVFLDYKGEIETSNELNKYFKNIEQAFEKEYGEYGNEIPKRFKVDYGDEEIY